MYSLIHLCRPRIRGARACAAALLLFAGAAGCSRAAPAAQAPGPVPVGVQVLASSQVTRSSDFVSVLKSRRSAEVRPQVEGIVTRIFVKSGARVGAGAVLLQIDALKQQAAVQSDELDGKITGSD